MFPKAHSLLEEHLRHRAVFEERGACSPSSGLAIGYILVSVLVIFRSGRTFNTFFDAVYWAVVSLTVGRRPHHLRRALLHHDLLSSWASPSLPLPSGIFTAGMLDLSCAAKEVPAFVCRDFVALRICEGVGICGRGWACRGWVRVEVFR